MSEYVAFKCSLCSTEAASLEALEGHIWNRHLGTFQFHCSECSYPALNYQALAQHFHTNHQSCQDVQFKRKISDEIKLREIIAASIVCPLFEEEEQEHIYEDQSRVPQVEVLETVESEEILTETIPMEEMEVVHNQEEIIEEVDQNGQVIYVTAKEEYPDAFLDDEPSTSMIDSQGGQVVAISDDNGELVDCEGDNAYPIYPDHELLDEGYQYIDTEGNTVYVTDEYPYDAKAPNRIQVRATKHRHINMIVNNIAVGGKRGTKRATTIWNCPDCGKTIRYPSRIEEHRRMHNGDKPFSCQECGQKFAQKGALKCHMRSHSGERPYACTWDCGKTFVSASAQRMHEKYHSGEKPYACSVCGKLFGKRSHLVRHEQTVHMITTLEHIRLPPRGLEVAGSSTEILKGIVEGIVEEVRQDRILKTVKKEDRLDFHEVVEEEIV